MANSVDGDYYSYYYGSDCDNCCMNMSYKEASKLLLYNRLTTLYTQFLLPSLLFVGVLGNAAFVYVVAKQSLMRTATNVYLVNLAVSDIVFLVSAILAKVWAFVRSPFFRDDMPLGPAGCVLVPFLGDAAYFSSLLFMTLVSFEIFVAVCHPKRKSVVQHRVCSLWLSASAWMVSCVIAGLLAPSNSGLGYLCFVWDEPELTQSWPTTLAICGLPIEWIRNLVHFVQTVPFFITFFINVFLYVMIVAALHRSVVRLRAHASVKREVDTGLRNQIARMLVVNGVVFFLLLAPFEILSFLKATSFYLPADHEVTVSLVTRCLTYFNSVVNPVIYTAMSKRYREAFMNVLSKHAKKCRTLETTTERAAGHQSTQNYLRVSQVTTRI